MRYVSGIDERGAAIDVRDPMADALRHAAGIDGLLAMGDVFPPHLAGDVMFQRELRDAYATLVTAGARASVGALASR